VQHAQEVGHPHVDQHAQAGAVGRYTVRRDRRDPDWRHPVARDGSGDQPPSPEWGLMVSSGRSYLLDQWWVATIPGLAIFIVSFGFNLLGDGLRDVFDPRSQ
jgi:hypothetical protein